MKTLRNTLLFVCLLLMASLMMFAADNPSAKEVKKTINIDMQSKVGNINLKPDTYTLTWDDNSSNPQVHFMEGNKDLGAVSAKIVKDNPKNNGDFEYNTASGKPQLQRVFFKHEALVFPTSS